MKKILLSVATFLIVGVVSAQTADEVNTKFNEAATLLQAKNYKAAIPVLEETIKMAKTSEEDVASTLAEAQKHLISSYTNLGASDAKAKNYEGALDDLQKASALALETKNSAAQGKANNMIAAIYTLQGNEKVAASEFEAAAALYDKAVAINDKNTKNILTAAQVHAKAGNLEKAGTYYESLIELGKSHSKYAEDAQKAKDAYTIDLMNTAASATEFEVAEGAMNKVLAFDAENASALANLVKIANNFKKYDVVIANASKAITAQVDAVEKANLNFLLGAAYEIKQDKDKAIAAYKLVTSGDKADAAKKQIEALSK